MTSESSPINVLAANGPVKIMGLILVPFSCNTVCNMYAQLSKVRKESHKQDRSLDRYLQIPYKQGGDGYPGWGYLTLG